MTTFLRLVADKDKTLSLSATCAAVRVGGSESRVFHVAPESFCTVPGAPFAYWISDAVRGLFAKLPKFESETRIVRQGGVTGNDERYLRLWWETAPLHSSRNHWQWKPFAKGGSVSRWYSDFPVTAIWDFSRGTFGGYTGLLHRASEKPSSADHYFKGGLTWPLRAAHFAPVPLPKESIFSIRGYAILAPTSDLLPVASLCNSTAFDYIFKVALGRFGFPEFVVGILQKLPIPQIDESARGLLSSLMRRAWSLKRMLDTVEETSHAFLLPATLRPRLGDYDSSLIELELSRIQTEIDDIAFKLYDFSENDRVAAAQPVSDDTDESAERDADAADEEIQLVADELTAALSWAVGVAFGRFDWRLATGERQPPPDPDPFDPLPAKSPGMLPDGAEPFHPHSGILVDDQGHPNDLAHLIEEALGRVNTPVPDGVRRWLQRDFFAFHLQRYSKSRRKAPIYWPLATASGSYTLWLHNTSLSSQTLYTAVNDYVEPKVKQVGSEVTVLRNKGAGRSRDDERHFETLQAFELELIDLRDILLKLAPTYKPNRDDGVQISAAPLWSLFRHKPWQKVLKETWENLERGDFDWAYLAMNYWPERVREKCKTDRSLAIVHSLESHYVEPEAKPKKVRGRKKAEG